MSFVAYSPWHEMLGINQYVSIFFDGLLASGAVWGINAIVEWFEENRLSNQKIERIGFKPEFSLDHGIIELIKLFKFLIPNNSMRNF